MKKPQPPSPRRAGGEPTDPASPGSVSRGPPRGPGAASSTDRSASEKPSLPGNNNSNYAGAGLLGMEPLAGRHFVELPGGVWMDGTMFALGDLQKAFGADKIYTYEQMLISRAGGDPHGISPLGAQHAAPQNTSSALFSRLASQAGKTPRPPNTVAQAAALLSQSPRIGVNPSKSPAPRAPSTHHQDEDDRTTVGGHAWSELLQKPLCERQKIIIGELQQCRSAPLSVSQLSSIRSSSNGVLSPDQISPRLRLLPSLEHCQSAKRFVHERLKLLQTDENLCQDFLSKVRCIDIAEKLAKQGNVEHTEEYFLAQNAQRDISHAHFVEIHAHRMASTRENYVVQWTQRREELVHLNNVIAERSQRADSNRSFSSVAKHLARNWMTNILLFFSTRKLRQALLVGVRKKWMLLATCLMYFHWKNVVRRRKQKLERFRRNFILRKLIPRWMAIVKEKLRALHTDRVKNCLGLVSRARSFLRVIRSFMHHVRHAQRIYRRRKLARGLIFAAMCLRLDAVNHEMISDKSVGIYFPPALRNVIVQRLIQLESEQWAGTNSEKAELFLQELERNDRLLSAKVDHPVFENSLCIEAAMIVAARFPLLARNSCVRSILEGFRHGKKLTQGDKAALRTWVGLLYLELKAFEGIYERAKIAAQPLTPNTQKRTSKATFVGKTRSPVSSPLIQPTFITAVTGEGEGEVNLLRAAAVAVEQQSLTSKQQEQLAWKKAPDILVSEASMTVSNDFQSTKSVGRGLAVVQSLLQDESKRRLLRTIVADSMSHALSRRRSSVTNAKALRNAATRPPQLTLKQRLARCANGTFPLTDPNDDCFPVFSTVALPKLVRRKNLVDRRNMQVLMRLTKDAWLSATKQTALENISGGDLTASFDISGGAASGSPRLSVSHAHRKASTSIEDRISAGKQVYASFVDEYRRKSVPVGHGGAHRDTDPKDLETVANVDFSYLDGFFRRLR
jgi:hypothetical protein